MRKGISFEARVEALKELMSKARNSRSRKSMKENLDRIDALLFQQDVTKAETRHLEKKSAHLDIPVQRGIAVYGMMNRLMLLCEPKGPIVGPLCAVSLIDFENLDRAAVLKLRRMPLITRMLQIKAADKEGQFRGLELLNREERKLYKQARALFMERERPGQTKITLRSLATELLQQECQQGCQEGRRDSEEVKSYTGFSEQTVRRAIRAVSSFSFPDENVRRDYMLRSVNRFGAQIKSGSVNNRSLLNADALNAIGMAAVYATTMFSRDEISKAIASLARESAQGVRAVAAVALFAQAHSQTLEATAAIIAALKTEVNANILAQVFPGRPGHLRLVKK